MRTPAPGALRTTFLRSLPGQVHGQQEQDAQHQDGGDDQLRTGTRMVVVHVISRGPAGGAPALHHGPRALRANQVFAAHRNPFRLARLLAVTGM